MFAPALAEAAVYAPRVRAPLSHAIASPAFFAGHPSLAMTESCYRGGEEIYGEGEPAEYIYQVVSGAVRAYKLLSDGRRQIGAFLLPGDVFGLETRPAYRVTAEAIVGATVRLVKRSAVEKAAQHDARIACALWEAALGELRHAEDHMMLLGRKTAAERVATFLLEMDSRMARTGARSLPMCRRDIGDYLGLTLETVSRAISALQANGVVELSGARCIAVRKRDRLAAIAEVECEV
jgi:CRP/FNR family nitrogen fixation transcriptional regulator